MAQREIAWVLVNSNSAKEADKIGKAVLMRRLCACYALIPRLKSVYFWPPKTKRLESSKGPLLVLETLPKHYKKIVQLVKNLHSDTVPFIGRLEIEEVEKHFFQWLSGEVQRKA